jgi:hypothetical protein
LEAGEQEIEGSSWFAGDREEGGERGSKEGGPEAARFGEFVARSTR